MTDGAVVVILRVRETQQGDHILMPIVWKLDSKLKLLCRIAKRVTRVITRRSLRVTDGTDRRPRTAEELRAMTTHTRIMAWVIGDVWKGNLVAATAGGAVLLRGMRELRIISRR